MLKVILNVYVYCAIVTKTSFTENFSKRRMKRELQSYVTKFRLVLEDLQNKYLILYENDNE